MVQGLPLPRTGAAVSTGTAAGPKLLEIGYSPGEEKAASAFLLQMLQSPGKAPALAAELHPAPSSPPESASTVVPGTVCSDATSSVGSHSGPGSVAVTLLNPLGIRFSQPRINPAFADGSEFVDAVESCSLDEQCHMGPPRHKAQLTADTRPYLMAPFPPIEVVRWKPKLRNADGVALRDDVTGKAMLGEECWFTMDNRRLYCLQRAAIKHWPRLVVAAVRVSETVTDDRKVLGKFRTTTEGMIIDVALAKGPVVEWDWREEVDVLDSLALASCDEVDEDETRAPFIGWPHRLPPAIPDDPSEDDEHKQSKKGKGTVRGKGRSGVSRLQTKNSRNNSDKPPNGKTTSEGSSHEWSWNNWNEKGWSAWTSHNWNGEGWWSASQRASGAS